MERARENKFLKFAKDWETSESVGEVAKKNKMTCPEASRLAGRMRKMGIDLKKFRQAEPIDAEAIKAALKK